MNKSRKKKENTGQRIDLNRKTVSPSDVSVRAWSVSGVVDLKQNADLILSIQVGRYRDGNDQISSLRN